MQHLQEIEKEMEADKLDTKIDDVVGPSVEVNDAGVESDDDHVDRDRVGHDHVGHVTSDTEAAPAANLEEIQELQEQVWDDEIYENI